MLNCETETKAMGNRVLRAARKHFKKRRGLSSWFEHGQWWIIDTNGAQYSVCDAEGIGTTSGFDFECVTEPDD